MKVAQFRNKNQFEITTQKDIYLQSYDSMVVKIHDGMITFGKDWDFSKTTSKHVYMFLKENSDLLNYGVRYKVIEALESSNKKSALQKLIDSGLIEYDETL